MGISCKLFGHRWAWRRAQDICEESYECSRCQAIEETRTVDHTWGAWRRAEGECKEVRECNHCNTEEFRTVDHTWGAWRRTEGECKEVRECNHCNAEEFRTVDHTWGAWWRAEGKCKEIRECNHCNAEETRAVDCLYGSWKREEGRCNEHSVCTHCGQHYSRTIQHSWGIWQPEQEGCEQIRECTHCHAKESIVWYSAEDKKKRLRQVVVKIKPKREFKRSHFEQLPLVCKDSYLSDNSFATDLVLLNSNPGGSCLVIRTDCLVEEIRENPLEIGFSFFRMPSGGIFTIYVHSPVIERKINKPFLDMGYNLDESDITDLIRDTLVKDTLNIILAGEGGMFGWRCKYDIAQPMHTDCNALLGKEFAELLEYNQSLSQRNFQQSMNEMWRLMPKNEIPILKQTPNKNIWDSSREDLVDIVEENNHGTSSDYRKHLPMTLAIFTGPPHAPVQISYENTETAQAAENILIKGTEDLIKWYEKRVEDSTPTTLLHYIFPNASPEKASDVEQWYNGFFSPELAYHTQKQGISNRDVLEIKFNISSGDGGSLIFIAMKKDNRFVVKLLSILEQCWQDAGLSQSGWSKRFG